MFRYHDDNVNNDVSNYAVTLVEPHFDLDFYFLRALYRPYQIQLHAIKMVINFFEGAFIHFFYSVRGGNFEKFH